MKECKTPNGLESAEKDQKFDLMNRAIDEINTLRHHNEILRAKVETMDLFRAMLFAERPRETMGYSEDISWAMQRYLENAKTKPEKSHEQ